MEERLARIRSKLDSIRRRWFRRSSFGEESHRFVLQPPITDPVLEAFESAHGVRLPEEYREFLLQLGDGGAGPGYGLLSLDKAAAFPQADDDPPANYLSRLCPLRPEVSRMRDWLTSIDCSDDERYQGTIVLCDHGCCNYAVLVVSGPARGCVVNISLDDNPPVFARDNDFLAWYERWLDDVLGPRRLGDIAWFGYDAD